MRDQGFTHIYGYFVHPIFAHGAHEIVQQNLFTKIFVTSTIPLEHPLSSSIEIIDISAQLAQEIKMSLR
jgi:phosphoribosylpyrophosphate synthetase